MRHDPEDTCCPCSDCMRAVDRHIAEIGVEEYWRRRAETAERQRDEARDAMQVFRTLVASQNKTIAAAKERAEKAERERDEEIAAARSNADAWEREAEKNAALLARAREAEAFAAEYRAGKALIDEVHALRAVRDAASSFTTAARESHDQEQINEAASALRCAVDAAKGR